MDKLNEAAKKYAESIAINGVDAKFVSRDFKAGILSDVAEQYWYEQLKKEQKQLSDEEIQGIAQKNYPVPTTGNKSGDQDFIELLRSVFIDGFKAALNYKL